MSNLNDRQQLAVQKASGPMLVLAGAGSGKTRVITQKIAHLVKARRYLPDHICAVTFTNKAAREMKSRVGELLDAQQTKELSISTFHSLGLRIIRNHLGELGLRKGFSIFDAADSESLLRQLMREDSFDVVDAIGAAQNQLSEWKSALLTPDEAQAAASDATEKAQARIYREYQKALLTYNACDFDDLIARPVWLLESDPDVLTEWRHRIRYILVDEYQDTNVAQYRMLKTLAGEAGMFTVVGDDDQSIYAWRGAEPRNLLQLAEDYPKLDVVKLEQNYRCTGRILSAANKLIGNNPHLFVKKLWSAMGPGDPIRVLPARSSDDEAQRIVSDLMLTRLSKGIKHSDFAILYRGNHQARPFERALRDHGIPYQISGGISFFDRAEIKDLMAYLKLLANSADDTAFLRIVNTPRREVGPGTLEKLAGFAGQKRLGLFAACLEPDLKSAVGQRRAAKLRGFAQWIQTLGEDAAEGNPARVFKRLIEESEYQTWIKDQAKDPAAADRALENLRELLDWIERLHREHGESLPELLARISLLDMLDREAEDSGDQVRLMTLHAAKGLEFPRVYLVGFEEELLPHHQCLDGDALEEERRIAYVGITRARQCLTLSYARERRRFGETRDCEPSRFLEEIGEDLLHWEGRRETTKDEARKQARSAIAGLRAMLSER